MDALPVIVDRVRRRLDAVGLSASAASAKAGLTKDAIRNMERAAQGKLGARKSVSARTIQQLAPVLRTTVGWLLEGEGAEEDPALPANPAENDDQDRNTVPVKGYVGAGSTAHFYNVDAGDLDRVAAPPGSSATTVAVEIRGDSLGSLFDRWLVFYDDIRSPVTADLVGRLCVVGLPDDRVLIKKVKRGSQKGLFDLLSERAETIKNVAIVWAAAVRHMAPK